MVEPKNTHLDHHKNREFGSKGKEGKGTQVQLTRRGKVHITCDESDHDSDDNTTEYSMYHLNEDNRKREPYRVSLSLNEEDISLELDTRARKTVTSEFSP